MTTSPADAPILRVAGEYAGQAAIRIAFRQVSGDHTAYKARKVVDDWVTLLSDQPMAITDLQFLSRTPKRLFEATRAQTQLRRLVVKWGDYQDLSVLAGMTDLRQLQLRGASAVSDLGPLTGLIRLDRLAIEGFARIDDTSPLAHLTRLRDLELGGKWTAPRNGHINSVNFLNELKDIEALLIHTCVVEDLDYTPLLSLPKLKSVCVMAVPGMHPTCQELQRQLPWSG